MAMFTEIFRIIYRKNKYTTNYVNNFKQLNIIYSII